MTCQSLLMTILAPLLVLKATWTLWAYILTFLIMCGLQSKIASGVSYLQKDFTKIVQYVSSIVWDCSWVLTAIIFIPILFTKKKTSQLLLWHIRRKFFPNLNTPFQDVVYTASLWRHNSPFPKVGAPPSLYYIIHLFLLLFSPTKDLQKIRFLLLLQETIPSKNAELSYTPSSLAHSVVEI